jgi:hypothetical protein
MIAARLGGEPLMRRRRRPRTAQNPVRLSAEISEAVRALAYTADMHGIFGDVMQKLRVNKCRHSGASSAGLVAVTTPRGA